jgi:hypothetical protein
MGHRAPDGPVPDLADRKVRLTGNPEFLRAGLDNGGSDEDDLESRRSEHLGRSMEFARLVERHLSGRPKISASSIVSIAGTFHDPPQSVGLVMPLPEAFGSSDPKGLDLGHVAGPIKGD